MFVSRMSRFRLSLRQRQERYGTQSDHCLLYKLIFAVYLTKSNIILTSQNLKRTFSIDVLTDVKEAHNI